MGGVEFWINFAVMIAKILLIMIGYLTATAYNTLFERKISAWLQQRIGPNRAGFWGLLQPISDAVKLFFKEDIMPSRVHRFFYVLAPIISIFCAIMAFAVIPVGDSISLPFLKEPVKLVVADVNVAILYLLALSSLAIYGIVLAGWSSNNKYSLLGGMRSTAQMISYEVTLGLSIIPVIMMSGTMSLTKIVESQADMWNVFRFPHGPIAFALFFIAMLAETNRAPFDFVEAEQELVAGYHTEYSSMKFGGFFVAEYGNMITASAIMATLFFGGWQGLPFLGRLYIPGFFWFFAKVLLFLFMFVWIRWSLPRFRYDQLMKMGWKIFLPLALANLFITNLMQVVGKHLGTGYFG